MPTRGTRLIPLALHGPAGSLEALLQERVIVADPAPGQPVAAQPVAAHPMGVHPAAAHANSAHPIAAVVCHPHPLYGGTLHNKVVHRTAAVLHSLGASVLRFNFRGVGKSEGRFDRGEGELEDARAALRYQREHHEGARLWVAGFSFGSWVAARLAASESDIERLILVAPPVRTSSFEVLRTAPVTKWVFQGTADDICPLAALEEEYPAWSEPKTLVKLEGATHFFDMKLGALAEAMSQALGGSVAGGTSEIT